MCLGWGSNPAALPPPCPGSCTVLCTTHTLLAPLAHHTCSAAGEEEEADEFPLGSVEKAPASLRAPSAGVCASFRSDHLKHEASPPESSESTLTSIVLGAPGLGSVFVWVGWGGVGELGAPTVQRVDAHQHRAGCVTLLLCPVGRCRVVLSATLHCCQPVVASPYPSSSPFTPTASTPCHAERTAHLRPGTQFIKSFWMTEGVRVTGTSVVRNAVHKVNKQPVSIKFYGWVGGWTQGGVGAGRWKEWVGGWDVNKQPISIGGWFR